jgi:hypothetical protein
MPRRKKKKPAPSHKKQRKPKPRQHGKRRAIRKIRAPRSIQRKPIQRKPRPKPKTKVRPKAKRSRRARDRQIQVLEKRLHYFRKKRAEEKIVPLSETRTRDSDRRVRAVDKVLRLEGFDVKRKRKRGKRAIDTVITVTGLPKDPIELRDRLLPVFEKMAGALLRNKRGLRGLRLAVQMNPSEEIWRVYKFQHTPMITAMRVLGRKNEEETAFSIQRLAITNILQKMAEYRWDVGEMKLIFREELRREKSKK